MLELPSENSKLRTQNSIDGLVLLLIQAEGVKLGGDGVCGDHGMFEGGPKNVRRDAVGQQRPDDRGQNFFLHLAGVLVPGGDQTAEDGVVGAASTWDENRQAGAEILGL